MKQRLLRTIASTRNYLSKLIHAKAQSLPPEQTAKLPLRADDITSEATKKRLLAAELPIPASFTALLGERTTKKVLSPNKLPEWHLNNKLVAHHFAAAAGCRAPKNYQQRISCQEITIKPGSVIKPYQGASSSGVFFVHGKNNIVEKQTGSVLNQTQLRRALQAYEDDRWIVEELIAGPNGQHPRDLKFYCFYGQVVLVLEKSPDNTYCFWDASGQVYDTGKYQPEDCFDGQVFTNKQLEQAAQLCQEIPTPFIRIDFLDPGGQKDLVFGEFTPRPGGYARVNRQTDTLLGNAFLDAERRLFDDLLAGKDFTVYKKSISG